jgi:hypothetical protein
MAKRPEKAKLKDIEFRAYKFQSNASKRCRRKMRMRAKRAADVALRKEIEDV